MADVVMRRLMRSSAAGAQATRSPRICAEYPSLPQLSCRKPIGSLFQGDNRNDQRATHIKSRSYRKIIVIAHSSGAKEIYLDDEGITAVANNSRYLYIQSGDLAYTLGGSAIYNRIRRITDRDRRRRDKDEAFEAFAAERADPISKRTTSMTEAQNPDEAIAELMRQAQKLLDEDNSFRLRTLIEMISVEAVRKPTSGQSSARDRPD